MIQVRKLRAKTSMNGDDYMVGRMGGVRVLVMLNKRPESEGDATHVLMFTEAPQSGQASQAPANAPAQRGAKRPRIEDDDTPLVDDPIPL